MKPHVLSRAPKLIKFPQGGALPSSAAANGSDVSNSTPGKGTKLNRTLFTWQLKPEFTGFMLGQQAPVAGEMKTEWDDLCLDYNYDNQNVYMHPCHDGTNQKWHINPDGSMGTAWDDLCLDYNYGNQNVYMHPCHGGANQKWVHPQRTLNAAVPVAAVAPAGELKTEYDDHCLDYNYGNGNVYMHPCHGGANQQWFFEPGTGLLKTQWDDKCLDYNTGNGNVIMWECHGNTNQQWHINPDGSMGTAYDSKCLDYNYNNMNVYMHPCHGGANQKWVHPQRTANAAAAAPPPPAPPPAPPPPPPPPPPYDDKLGAGPPGWDDED